MVVEFLPPVPGITDFADRWYPEVLKSARRTHGVWHASAPAFLATKINAFLDGRRGNFASSKDIEDILAVLDGREEVAGEIAQAQPELRSWLIQKLRYFSIDADFLIDCSLPGWGGSIGQNVRLPRRADSPTGKMNGSRRR